MDFKLFPTLAEFYSRSGVAGESARHPRPGSGVDAQEAAQFAGARHRVMIAELDQRAREARFESR